MRVVLLMVLGMSLACGAGPEQPVDPVWGKQACEHCMMLVSEPRPAAQAVLPGGTRKFFDDVGCLVEWLDRSGEVPLRMWVRPPAGDGWIDARAARYGEGQRTPMDYGFLASDGGRSFEELRVALRARRAARAEVPR
jgi:copper chaperone NosL